MLHGTDTQAWKRVAYNFYICHSHACSLRCSSIWTMNLRRLPQRRGRGPKAAALESSLLESIAFSSFTLGFTFGMGAVLHLSSYFYIFILSPKHMCKLRYIVLVPNDTFYDGSFNAGLKGCTQLLMHIDIQVGLLCGGYQCILESMSLILKQLTTLFLHPHLHLPSSPPPVQLSQARM